MKRCILTLGVLLVCVIWPLRAANDSIRISLLTCAPGTEIYSLFGHTAIRYQNLDRGEDYIYNYGVFSFNTPNFIYRFVKGETDYQLGVVPYAYFEYAYAERGSSVYQQTLNLTYEEKIKLKQLLDTNYRPENRVYRYNYFFDNCTTRARDKIEAAIHGKVVYPEGAKGLSFRSIIHQYTVGHEWGEWGIDFLLGEEADAEIDMHLQQFAPFYMLESARKAYIQVGDSQRPLVLEEEKIVDVDPLPAADFPLSPFQVVLAVMVLTVIVQYMQYKKGRIFWIWDLLLFGFQGLAGCIIAFLFFFSVHPTVGSNWLLWVFNPLPLLYLPVMIYRAIKGRKDLFHKINIVYLTIFIILMPFVAQEFQATMLPLALIFILCSIGHVVLYNRKIHS